MRKIRWRRKESGVGGRKNKVGGEKFRRSEVYIGRKWKGRKEKFEFCVDMSSHQAQHGYQILNVYRALGTDSRYIKIISSCLSMTA